jgi:hypothetical protein
MRAIHHAVPAPRATQRSLRRFFLSSILALGGCSWSVFSDYELQAPAVRVEQSGDIRSGSFGDAVVGIDRGSGAEGGALFVAGNGDSGVSTMLFSKDGSVNNSAADRDKIKVQLDSPTKMTGLAALPGVPSPSGGGPVCYLTSVAAGVGTVRAIDINRFGLVSPAYDAVDSWTPKVVDFGQSVAVGAFADGTTRDDVAVGARDAVVVLKAAAAATLQLDDTNAGVFANLPAGTYSVLATGDLDPSTPGVDEIVAGAPEANSVVVLNKVGDCLTGTCTNVLTLAAPSGAKGFGGALAIAEADGKKKIVVGASESNQVFVFAIKDPFAVELEATLETPSGARSFGSGLAYGRFTDGSPLLAVGAPSTAVDGATDAGKIFLYEWKASTWTALTPGGVAPVSPTATMLLGRRLSVLPFRVGTQTHDILVASGREAVFAFFADLVAGHKDIRIR